MSLTPGTRDSCASTSSSMMRWMNSGSYGLRQAIHIMRSLSLADAIVTTGSSACSGRRGTWLSLLITSTTASCVSTPIANSSAI
jgi:hypothetical protein